MDFLTRLERKIGFITISNLPLFIVATQGLVYVWLYFNPGETNRLVLIPDAVFVGHEYWRLLTFLFVSQVQNPIFEFFYLYFLYLCGMALEEEWGSFRFTLFYLIGALGTLAAGFFLGSIHGGLFLNTTLFLAFATLHPDYEILLFFILPIKVKWIALLTFLGYIWLMLMSPWFIRAAIIVSLANYLLFFGGSFFAQIKAFYRREMFRRRFKE